MRLTGFASGLDLNQMVSDLMKAQRMPLNKLTQQKTLLEWKRDSYRDVNKLLTEFSNLSFDMTLQRSYTQKAVTTSNSQKVTATAPPTATNGTYTISNVEPATNAYTFTQSKISNESNNKINLSEPIWNQKEKLNSAASTMWNEKGTIATSKAGDGRYTLDKSKAMDIQEIKVIISGEEVTLTVTSNQDPVEGTVFINHETGELTFSENQKPDDGSEIKGIGDVITFSITTYNQEGKEVTQDFQFDKKSTLNDVIREINNSKVGITAFYDEGMAEDKIMFTRKETGDFNVGGNEMIFEGSFLTDVLGLTGPEQGGTKAEFTINGMQTSRNSNNFTINGVTFNLHEKTTDPITITVNNDTDKTFDTIKNYVDKYNELIEKLNGMISEPVYRDYKPLSDEERETLSERQQEQWEERARSGLLRNDSIISSALNQMRTAFYSTINTSGDIKQLAQLGITTSTNYMDKGKLQINEAKLREAIANDPNAVMELFTKAKGEDGLQGIARSLRETVQGTIRNIEARAGNSARTNQQFTIGREMINLDQRISSFEQRMQRVEERYWRQFTAMEKAIQQSNSQSTQLMSYFYQ